LNFLNETKLSTLLFALLSIIGFFSIILYVEWSKDPVEHTSTEETNPITTPALTNENITVFSKANENLAANAASAKGEETERKVILSRRRAYVQRVIHAQIECLISRLYYMRGMDTNPTLLEKTNCAL
jgi:hypothetical protein